VVGGSIAGCAAAIALSRVGCDVTVYERSPRDLADRGFGIGLPLDLHEELVSAGYLDAATPYIRYLERFWRTAAGEPETVRELARQPFSVACENWAMLWRALRARVPAGSYQAGAWSLATTRTPDWAAMRPEDFSAWWSALLSGRKLLYE
jgi:2-polyprenyl-6-methoxyphenol hydroxylase-like FAD-dependent oxidoreductase